MQDLRFNPLHQFCKYVAMNIICTSGVTTLLRYTNMLIIIIIIRKNRTRAGVIERGNTVPIATNFRPKQFRHHVQDTISSFSNQPEAIVP